MKMRHQVIILLSLFFLDSPSWAQWRQVGCLSGYERGTCPMLDRALRSHEIWDLSSGSRGQKISLERASVTRSNLVSINLARADLRWASFRSSILRSVSFSGADLQGADLRFIDGPTRFSLPENAPIPDRGPTFPDAIPNVSFFGADLRSAKLSFSDFSGANFEYADLSNVSLHYGTGAGANFRNANLTGAWIGGASFARSDLREANLSRCSGADADFNSALMGQANLQGAWLISASFVNADLRGADLRRAHLSFADFGGADLTGAHLGDSAHPELWMNRTLMDGAILSGVDFRQMNLSDAAYESLRTANIEGAIFREDQLDRLLSLTKPGLLEQRSSAYSRDDVVVFTLVAVFSLLCLGIAVYLFRRANPRS